MSNADNNTMFGHAYIGSRWRVCGPQNIDQSLYWHRGNNLIQFYVEPLGSAVWIDPKEHDTEWQRYRKECEE